jgi:hypothetical protein
VQGRANSITRAVSKAKLTGASGRIEFQYNPTEISISHNAEGYSDPIGKKEADDRSLLHGLATRGATRIILSSLTFTGDNCQSIVDTLMTWVTQFQPPSSREQGQLETPKPRRERLQFEWGPVGSGFHYTVELMRFDCTYTRFTRDGRPIRAEVRNLTLHVVGSNDAAANGGQSRLSLGSHRASPGRADAGARIPAGADNPLDANADPVRVWTRGQR